MLRQGVMGGTFDPVHLGHLRTAEEVTEALALDSLLFIPAGSPPHKPDRRIASFAHRYRMLELATEGQPRFRLSDVEAGLPGKSYTAVTLRTLLQEALGPLELYFLVGMDAFLEVDTWWHFRELFRLAHLVVLQRPGYDGEQVERFLKQKVSSLYHPCGDGTSFEHPELLSVRCMRNTRLEISSSRVRRLALEGKSIRYLVPDRVMRYIVENGLYRYTTLEQNREEKEVVDHGGSEG